MQTLTFFLSLFFVHGMTMYSAHAQVDIKSIPAKFSPRTQQFEIPTDKTKAIRIKLPGSIENKAVVINYLKNAALDKVVVKVHSVEFDARTSVSGVRLTQESTSDYSINMGGIFNYSCSIKLKNNKISSLEGACFIRIDIDIPKNAKIEIYNKESLLTKKFYPTELRTLFADLTKTSQSDAKLQMLQDFIASYKSTNTVLVLNSSELSQIVKSFAFSSDKLEALKKMHSFVVDRENLSKAINESFLSTFDRRDAYAIVGLKS